MSDINLDDLPAYIEGLQAEIERKVNELADCRARHELQRIEIERLQKKFANAVGEIAAATNEIERLRTDRDAIGFAAAEQIAERDAEIERLNQLLRFITKDCHKAADEIERLRRMVKYQNDVENGLAVKDAEIEQLREANNELAEAVEARGEEIERLRGGVLRFTAELEKRGHTEAARRVREALGDKP